MPMTNEERNAKRRVERAAKKVSTAPIGEQMAAMYPKAQHAMNPQSTSFRDETPADLAVEEPVEILNQDDDMPAFLDRTNPDNEAKAVAARAAHADALRIKADEEATAKRKAADEEAAKKKAEKGAALRERIDQAKASGKMKPRAPSVLHFCRVELSKNPNLTIEELQKLSATAGFEALKVSTAQSVQNDFRATLRALKEAGRISGLVIEGKDFSWKD